MIQGSKPAGSPPCWGYQFTDGDRECVQCDYQTSCKTTCINKTIAPQLTQIQPKPVQNTMVPIPPRPFLGAGYPPAPPPPPMPQVPQVPAVFRPPTPMAPPQPPVVQYQQYPQYQQAGSIPDPNNPNPLIPMMRPGAQQPAYYFNQFPGESVVERLGKNVALRTAESVFGELAFFFRHWTWPKRY